MGPREYDVALSYVRVDSAKAEPLAKALEAAGVVVFYDQHEQENLWGKDLGEQFALAAGKMARFFVPLLSAAYVGSDWTRHEVRAALERAIHEKREYILPVRLDESVALPVGLLSTTHYLRWTDASPGDIVRALLMKLAHTPADQGAAPAAGAAAQPRVAPIAGVDRDALYDALCALLPAQFTEVVFRLRLASAQLMPEGKAQTERAGELIQRVEQPGGPGLDTLTRTIRRVAPALLG